MKNILLIEDDVQITNLLSLHLHEPFYKVTACDKGGAALEKLAASAFDLVILDGPPALAGPDALLLAGLADGVVLCLRWHDTPRHVVARAAALLAEAAAHKAGRLLGSVLTRVAIHDAALTGSAESDVYSRRYAAYFRE